MMLSVLLLLLLLLVVSRTQAGFYGYIFTYTTKGFEGVKPMGISHVTVGFSSCQEADSGYCGGACDQMDESSGEWCQKERVWNWIDSASLHLFEITYGSWTPNINGVSFWRYVLYIELRNRSDIGKPNSSPQTTIFPALRVPSNCQRNISLLAFDPDGDEVKCRYANESLSECNDCTPPSVLNLSSSCILSFSPTNSSDEGPYAVQLMMEDFPRQTMILTDSSGVEVVRTTSDFISKTSLQFVLNVDPAAPSCTEGVYLPTFLPPTPENGAEIFTTINQMVEIPVRAEATQSEITELLFSGPHDFLKSSSGAGEFTLSWTPSDAIFDEGLCHPICFIVQSHLSSSVFQSELRCVVVTVGNVSPTTAVPVFPTTTPLTTASQTPMIIQSTSTLPPTTQGTIMAPPTTTTTPAPPTSTSINTSPDSTLPPEPNYIIALKMKISTTLSLSSAKDTIIQLIKEEFKRRGLTSDITIRFSDGSVQVTTPTPSGQL